MKSAFLSLAVLSSIALGSRPASAGDVLDRIVARVNGRIILQSDWEDSLRFEAFVDGRLPRQLSAKEAKAELDRLIDQELLREQMRSSDLPATSAGEVETRVQEIRKMYPSAKTDAEWHNLLGRFGLSEDELKSRLHAQLDSMRLIEAHLRPAVTIDSHSIENYYNQQLLPQFLQTGKDPVPLQDITPKIKELLTQEKMDQLLIAWLQNLHAASDIYIEQRATVPERQVQ